MAGLFFILGIKHDDAYFFFFNPVISTNPWEQFHGPWEQPPLSCPGWRGRGLRAS